MQNRTSLSIDEKTRPLDRTAPAAHAASDNNKVADGRSQASGPIVPLVGLAGVAGFVLAMSFLCGVILRALVVTNSVNPFAAEGMFRPGNATPDPAYLAPSYIDGKERITVLLLGSDTRPAEQGYRMPTDTIMLLSLDQSTQQAGVVSIPRDVYVDIPGYGEGKINTAYSKGGGPLAMEAVTYNFGVAVDHYVAIEFEVFIAIVDEIGGIDLVVPKTIDDPNFPADCFERAGCGLDPLYVEAGPHHFDGWEALRYARTRQADSDYDRAYRQQAVLMAVRERILSLEMLPTLLQSAPALYATLEENITTDMTLDQMVALANAAAAVPEGNIRQAVIDRSYLVAGQTESGATGAKPDVARIHALFDYVYWVVDTPPASAGP